MSGWTLIRFLHIGGAAFWVGGQLALSLIVLPPMRRRLAAEDRQGLLTVIGRRFGMLTVAVFLPLQVSTGILLARHRGVGWSGLLEPGYGRTLLAKLLLVTAVMVVAAMHGWARSRELPGVARAAAIATLIGSVGVLLLAAGLPMA